MSTSSSPSICPIPLARFALSWLESARRAPILENPATCRLAGSISTSDPSSPVSGIFSWSASSEPRAGVVLSVAIDSGRGDMVGERDVDDAGPSSPKPLLAPRRGGTALAIIGDGSSTCLTSSLMSIAPEGLSSSIGRGQLGDGDSALASSGHVGKLWDRDGSGFEGGGGFDGIVASNRPRAATRVGTVAECCPGVEVLLELPAK